MTHCGWLSDRIPAVVLGRSEWTPQEVQHLQECPSCQREWEVVRAVGRHDQDPELRIDTEALAAAVLRRLREDPAAPRFRRSTWAVGGLAAAAAIIIAIWTGGTTDTMRGNGSLAAAQLEIPLPELETLQAAELDSVLRMLEEPNNSRDPDAGEPELDDLNPDELKRVLDTWEG